MIQLQQMLQSASLFVWDSFDIVNSNWLDVDGSSARCPAEAELRHS